VSVLSVCPTVIVYLGDASVKSRSIKFDTPFRWHDKYRQTDEPSQAVQCALQDYHRDLWEVERIWGVDRLPALVGVGTRKKWWAAVSALYEALRANDEYRVLELVQNLQKGLTMLVEEAEAAGYGPLDLDIWEAPMSDGKILQIVRTFPADTYQPRDTEILIWTLEDVVKLIEAQTVINHVKKQFPGATINKF